MIRAHYHLTIFSNRYLLAAIGISLALQMILLYVPFLAETFAIVPLGLLDWAWIVAAALGIIGVNTLLHKVRKLSPGGREIKNN